MASRFNAPPNWPAPPEGWTPPAGWNPDPSWGPVPPGWQLWVEDGTGVPTTSPTGADGLPSVPAPTQAAPPPATKPWIARHKVVVGMGVVVALFILIGAFNGAGSDRRDGAATIASATPDEQTTADEAAAAAADATGSAEASAQAEAERLAAEQRAAEQAAADEAAAAAAAAEVARIGTVAQQNAYRSAVSYLDYSAFSRSGLADQLLYEDFSAEDAEFALARLEAEGGVDWNAQAAASAANYLEFTSFSHSGLVDQLVYEGFTPEQAEYGVSTTGL